MNDPIIKKPRSLQSKDEGGWSENNIHKHFCVNGAEPDERPSNGKSRKKHNSLICKRSPDKEHHYEIQCEWFTYYRETMRYICTYCGYKGNTFSVNVGPLPEWLKKWKEKYGFDF